MNYQAIVSELLLALRGQRSSMDVSRAMGYDYNQVSRWESGKKQLRWDEFCAYCQALNIPLSDILRQIFQFHRPDPLEFLPYLYSVKYKLFSIETLAEKLHRHPSAVRRYLDGKIFPELEFVLAYIDLDEYVLPNFVGAILPPESVTNLRSQFLSSVRQMEAEADNPLAAAIEGWLITSEYEVLAHHSDEFIAERVGSTAANVGQILMKMLEVGTLTRVENGKFSPTYYSVSLTGRKLLNFAKFWIERAGVRYSLNEIPHRGPVRGAGAVRIVAVSQDATRKINEALVRAYSEIRMIIDQQEGPRDDVRVILLDSFSTQDFK